MSEQEIKAAIAEQEEYLRRQRSCQGRLYAPHTFGSFRSQGQPGSVAASDIWSACIICGVTETPEDYRTKMRQEK